MAVTDATALKTFIRYFHCTFYHTLIQKNLIQYFSLIEGPIDYKANSKKWVLINRISTKGIFRLTFWQFFFLTGVLPNLGEFSLPITIVVFVTSRRIFDKGAACKFQPSVRKTVRFPKLSYQHHWKADVKPDHLGKGKLPIFILILLNLDLTILFLLA